MIDEDPTSQTALRRDGRSARRGHGRSVQTASTVLLVLVLLAASVWAGRAIGLALTAPPRGGGTASAPIGPTVVVDTPSRWSLDDHAREGRLLVSAWAGSKPTPYVLKVAGGGGGVETIHAHLPDALYVPLAPGWTYWVAVTVQGLPPGFEQMRSEVVTIVPNGTTSLQVDWPTRRHAGASS